MYNEKELLERINARLKKTPITIFYNSACFLCGRPATGSITKSEDPSNAMPVCTKCGRMISREHFSRGRSVFIAALTREDLQQGKDYFEKGLSNQVD